MGLTIYNSLSRKKELFTPIESGIVKMYVCGMTVYSDAHIGHARTYLAFDIIRRYLEYKGFKVTYIQNITDVDDKIIASAQREHIDPLVYSKRFSERCLKDLDDLGIRRADQYPKASELIPDMVIMIEQLLKKDYAYVADGDVYFSVEHFKNYGKLSGQNILEMKSGARIDPGDHKKNPLDFALWKKVKPGEPSWPSPWGPGRPGWHIECSAMSSKYLGLPFDIHGGGMDLRFPHHENEIAQSEAASGKPFANYWMHIGLLTVDGEKMSKSIGNIVNIRDILEIWDPEVIRMFFAQTHYRSPPDFSEKALTDVEKGLERIYRVKEKLETLSASKCKEILDEKTLSDTEQQYLKGIHDFQQAFEAAMDDDFNTPKAFALLFDFVNTSNRFFEKNEKIDPALCGFTFAALLRIGGVLTLFQPKKPRQQKDDSSVGKKLQTILLHYRKSVQTTDTTEIIQILLKLREEARAKKDWATADSIRKELQSLGFEIQDTEQGSIWRKK